MCALAFCFFLILLSQDPVSAKYGTVEDWLPHEFSYMMSYPNQKIAKTIASPVHREVKSPSGKAYTAICANYVEEEPRVDIFTRDGVFIDVVILAPIDDPCDQNFISTYISPQDTPNEDILKFVYLMSSKSQRCVERTYTVSRQALIASVTKSSYPIVPCPANVNKLLAKLPDGQQVGGVLGLGPMDRTDSMEYNSNVRSVGQPTFHNFPTADPEGKFFRLACREDILNSEDPVTKKTTILTGMIVHEENEDVFLDKFKLSTCSLDYINVNRRFVNGHNEYKVVFKTVKGECFERTYEYFATNFFYYYNQIAVHHLPPIKVKCPKKFEGDIGLNARRHWIKRLLPFFFKKKEKFAKIEN